MEPQVTGLVVTAPLPGELCPTASLASDLHCLQHSHEQRHSDMAQIADD